MSSEVHSVLSFCELLQECSLSHSATSIDRQELEASAVIFFIQQLQFFSSAVEHELSHVSEIYKFTFKLIITE